MRRCVICGNNIRTGTKYCYIHRSFAKGDYAEQVIKQKKENRKQETDILMVLFLKGVGLIFIGLFAGWVFMLSVVAIYYIVRIIMLFTKKQNKEHTPKPRATFTSAINNSANDFTTSLLQARAVNRSYRNARFR